MEVDLAEVRNTLEGLDVSEIQEVVKGLELIYGCEFPKYSPSVDKSWYVGRVMYTLTEKSNYAMGHPEVIKKFPWYIRLFFRFKIRLKS